MLDLFKWGFVLAMGLTWLAVGIGALMLLIPGKARMQHSVDTVDHKHAA